MAGFATFPALLPTFLATWSLSNTQAGWISGIYYAGYMITVPVLVSLTDRVDARRILFFGMALGSIASLGFALFAGGFWTALLFRFLAGISLAGTYMPGLKVVSDHNEGPPQSRHIAFYTASFSIGASVSYLLAGEVSALLGWSWAFGSSALGPLVAMGLIAWFIPPGEAHSRHRPATSLLDFRPVLRARPTLVYILGYAAHTWELFGMRAWIVAFLGFSQSLQPVGSVSWSATQVAAVINLLGLPSSIGGNELARRFGRRRVVTSVMIVSVILSSIIGFTASLPYLVVVGLSSLYGMTVMGDSASLTAGVVAAAPPGYRGATMAIYSTAGFGTAFLGPLAVGIALDLFGNATTLGWGLGFLTMGLGCALGLVAFALFKHTTD
jgi:MFS family permease